MTYTYDDALEHVKEALDYAGEDREETAREAFNDFLESALTDDSDILELWDGGTHPDTDLGQFSDLMDAIRYNTCLQLESEWLEDVMAEALCPTTDESE